MEALGIISQNPVYQAMVDIPKMFTDLMRSIGVESYVSPQAKQAYQMAVQQQMQSQQMQAQQKLQEMGQQFQMRNEEAMKRDAFKHQLKRDDKMTDLGLESAMGGNDGQAKTG